MNKTLGLAISILASLAAACTQETVERNQGVEVIRVVPVESPPAPPPSDTVTVSPEVPEQDAGTAPAATPVCDKTLKVDVWRDETHVVHPGDTDIVLLRIRVTAPACSDAPFNGVTLSMFATQLSPQFNVPLCASTPCVSNDDFAFRNWKVKTAYNHGTYNGSWRAWHGWNVPQVVHISGWSDIVPKSESLELEVTADLAENYVLLEEGLHFRAHPDFVHSDMKVAITDHTQRISATVDTVIVNSR
jgi:hypothetical protein